MALAALPAELLQLVFAHLEVPRDINALARLNRPFYETFNEWIYLDKIARDGGHAILVYAAQMGHVRTIKRLLRLSTTTEIKTQGKVKLDPNGIVPVGRGSYFGWSPLAWAAVRGDEDVVKLLLEIEGIDVDHRCPKGRTALSFAAENGHVGIAHLLLIAGANPNIRDDLLRTPLHWAGSPTLSVVDEPRGFRSPHWWSYSKLRSKSPVYCPVKAYFEEDIAGSIDWDKEEHRDKYIKRCAEALDFDTAAPLTSISSSWSAGAQYKELLHLLIKYDANLELWDQKRRTPLCWAAACGYQILVEFLLENGASSHPESKWHRTALSWAAENGHAAIVQILMDQHDPNQPNNEHSTSSLSFAAMKGHYDTVQLLAERIVERERWSQGSNWHGMVWATDWGPLVWAAVGGYTRVVELLLSIHAKKWPNDPVGSIAVCWAACRGHTDVIRLLLAGGAEMGCPPEKYDTMTPLQLAAKNKHVDTVEYLLETEKAEINAVDQCGWTALTWTGGLPYIDQEDKNNTRIKQMLLNHGADPSFERPTRDVWKPPHSILKDGSDCQLCAITEWPMSFKIDWESLAQGKRMRDLPHHDRLLSLTVQTQFEGWSYNRPSTSLEPPPRTGLELLPE